eukprot:5021157-Prymnesium_polylepis.1
MLTAYLACRCALLAFSVLDIEQGSNSSSLGVGGGSDLYIVGTDLGDPFNAPTVLIGNNPNPLMTTCKVETFTSLSTRFHCTIDSGRLPTQPDNVGGWGQARASLLTLHVIVDGREAMCDNGDRIDGTGIGDCRLRFDIGATPLVAAVRTPLLGDGELLRLRALSKEPLSAASGDKLTIQLRRGSSLLGCPLLAEEDGIAFFEPPEGLGANDNEVGCRLRSDPAFAAGFWEVRLRSMEQNRGFALSSPAARRVDFASSSLYDVEIPPRISSVLPAAMCGPATPTRLQLSHRTPARADPSDARSEPP